MVNNNGCGQMNKKKDKEYMTHFEDWWFKKGGMKFTKEYYKDDIPLSELKRQASYPNLTDAKYEAMWNRAIKDDLMSQQGKCNSGVQNNTNNGHDWSG